MMHEIHGNVDQLLASVRRRSEQHILADRASLEETLTRIRREAEAEAERRKDALLQRGRVEAEEVCRQCLAAAERKRRVAHLEAREARLEAVFAAATERIHDLGKDGLAPEVVERLARNAATSLPPGPVTVTVDAASRTSLAAEDVAAWRSEVHTFTLDEMPLETGHGAIVRAGRASVDATLEGRLAQARDRLRGVIDGQLHGHGQGDVS